MENEEIFDTLNRLSPDEIVVLLYHKVLGVNLEQLPGHRWRFKTSHLDCCRSLNKLNAKRRKEQDHEERIAALQEAFISEIRSFFY